MVVAGIQSVILFELMLPFNGWFGVVLSQAFYIEVYKMVMNSFSPFPAEQFGLSIVCYASFNYFRIHCGTPFLVGLQVNDPYFIISTVPYHNLFRADHIDGHIIQLFTFHFFSKQDLFVNVGVKNNNFG